ncbi:MAG: peptidase M13, partial [Lactococcus lactis]|nr:peptidase M13 [Lactococcus lactis]
MTRVQDDLFATVNSVPFSFSVEPDMKDAIHYSLGFSGPGLLLPDTSYYDEKHPRKKELLEAIKFYNKAGDWEKREQADFSAVKAELAKVETLQSFKDFQE